MGDSSAPDKYAVAPAVDRIAALRSKASDELTPLGVVPFPDGPMHFPGAPTSSYDWVLTRLHDDPLFHRRELALPPAVKTKLVRLDRVGVHFDDLLIAHEVNRGSVTSSRPKPAEISEAILKAPTEPSRASRILDGTARGIALGAAGLAVAAASPFALVAAALAAALPDPILIGVIAIGGVPRAGEPVAVFEIARW